MKKFIVTSKSYSGEIVMVYDEGHKLVLLDFQQAELSAVQTKWLVERVPWFYHERDFMGAFSGASLEFVEEGYDVGFMEFWVRYDRKINAKRCKVLWERMSKVDRIKAYHGISTYFGYLKRNTWRNKMDPQTFLKDKAWENDWR